MMNKHAKSPCCSAPARRFGKRRRQCKKCKKTWRIRKRKRGRKKERVMPGLVAAYLSRKVATVRDLSQRRKESKSNSSRALSSSLVRFINKNDGLWQTLVPSGGKLVLVADAIWYHIKGEKHTIYVLLLRPWHGNEAVIWLPYLTYGHEDINGWRKAIAAIPPAIYARIGAIVCDGGTGVVNLAYRNGWLLQRCHFHLLAAVQNYLTTGPRSRHREFAFKVMGLVQTVITDIDMTAVQSALGNLANIRNQTKSRGLRRTVSGLLLHWQEYRTYLKYPDWHLPATSNAAESCIQCIRDLLRRCRGFRSEEQLGRWIVAFTINKKTIYCRPKNQPN